MSLAFQIRGMELTESFIELFERMNPILWQRIEKKEITMDELIRTRFDIMFAEAGIALDGYEFEKDFRKNLFNSAERVDNADEFLKYLSRKYPIYLASNGQQKQQENRIEIAGLSPYVTDIFTSERMGYSKPDICFFDRCFDLLGGITPEKTMFIGDSLTADVLGGNRFGMKTCWFDYHGSGNDSGIIPDYTIYSLLEIERIL